jgi:hypothetical protein
MGSRYYVIAAWLSSFKHQAKGLYYRLQTGSGLLSDTYVEELFSHVIDLYVREGRYGNELPFTPRQEAAGTVVAVGKGVSDLQEGDRVAWCSILSKEV